MVAKFFSEFNNLLSTKIFYLCFFFFWYIHMNVRVYIYLPVSLSANKECFRLLTTPKTWNSCFCYCCWWMLASAGGILLFNSCMQRCQRWVDDWLAGNSCCCCCGGDGGGVDCVNYCFGCKVVAVVVSWLPAGVRILI